MLKLDSVSHSFPDGTRAIKNINLDIQQGEFCVLLGPSGSGKSTLMGMINGLITPSHGEIFFKNERITSNNIKRLQQRISMIHQQLHLIPRISVINNIIAGKLHAISTLRSLFKCFTQADQRRACELLDEVDLEERHLHRRASELSGGQQQRVAIARAFISSPEVVLADEPIASLDPTISHSVLTSLKNTSSRHNTTVICSLHQVDFALQYADRIVALRDGQVIYDGTPELITNDILDALYEKQSSDLTSMINNNSTQVSNIEKQVA